MKGLIIAFSYSPNKNVGALRPTYWAEEAIGVNDFSLDVVTATESNEETTNYKKFYVKNTATSAWSFLIKDEGLTWSKNLKQFFKNFPVEEYDFVVFTGGPFFQFSLGKFFKKRGLKVIFDFRDPFSDNPRFKDNWFKKKIKSLVEGRFLKCADLVVSVNNACHELIGPSKKLNRAVIANGYDERAVDLSVSSEEKYDLFYAGHFYWEPTDFFKVIQDSEMSLVHAGVPQKFKSNNISLNKFSELGLMKQRDMYKELRKAEIGVLFTMNVPFESTTKLYDYLAFNKKILVITQGEPNTGVLRRELKEYPNYRWVKNEYSEIKQALLELKNLKVVQIDASKYSRKEGLRILVKNIQELND